MKKFTSVKDVPDIYELVQEARALKEAPYSHKNVGQNKTLGLIFLNPSLRTRLSTQKAGKLLGMDTMVMNFDKEGWALETQEGVVMNGNKAEHVAEAAAVVGEYCDIIGVRSFPKLRNKEEDYSDSMLKSFIKYSSKPVVSLESAIRHPLQSLTDLMTIEELKTKKRPKVVLTWAPHVKNLPQAVPNSFAEWMNLADVDLVVTHPEGYELSEEFVDSSQVVYNQSEALRDADFVYAKNWSSYKQYGQILNSDSTWMVTADKMALTNDAKFMHCLPVRRNLIVTEEVLNSRNSVVIRQAGNRVWAAQAVLKKILEAGY